MRDGLEQVQAQLQALSANGQAAYRLEDRAVGYEIRRAPPTDLRPLSAALVDHLTAVEASAVAKLDTVYGALERAADAEDDASQGASLRVALEAYLGAGCGAGCGADADGAAAAAAVAAEPPQAINTEEPTSLRADARELLSERHGAKAGGAGIMSARAVARVLHGLGSPAFPAQEWRRHRLWERHGSTDFALVMRVASEELLVVRGIKR
jgi:ATP-dependent DNA helicase Q4